MNDGAAQHAGHDRQGDAVDPASDQRARVDGSSVDDDEPRYLEEISPETGPATLEPPAAGDTD